MAFHWEFVRGTETHTKKQMWQLYRKCATEKISLWRAAKEPLCSSQVEDLAIMEKGVIFLVDGHYHATVIASHLTNHQIIPLASWMQKQNAGNVASISLLAWIFTAPLVMSMRESSSSQGKIDGNEQILVTPLCIYSETGSFLLETVFAKQRAHFTSDEGRGRKGLVTNTANYMPSPSSETQQNHVYLHVYPLEHTLGNSHLSTLLASPACTSTSLTHSPYEELGWLNSGQALLSNNSSALFHTRLRWITVMKNLQVCEVYNFVFLSGAQTKSPYTPLQLLKVCSACNSKVYVSLL